MELDRFLWAELQIRMPCRLKLMSPAQIDDELDKPPAALASTYEAIYAMINAEPVKDDRVNAKNELRWIMCSKRPSSPDE
jgi:hypothetical protein